MPKERRAVNIDKFFAGSTLDFLAGVEPEKTAQAATELGLPLLHLPANAIAPDPEQLRRLPPVALLEDAAARGDTNAARRLADLRALGESMQALGQIQPVIVYQDPDPANPAITHRLLNGQRRWSAAMLVGMPTIWAVEVPRPTAVDRVLHQFAENEQREGFTDMERAWALQAFKGAITAEHGPGVSWRVVEQRMQLSPERRRDLLRLLRFSPEGQQLIQQHGWSEWTLRKLHQALEDGTIDAETATDILRVLADEQQVTASVVQELVARLSSQLVDGDPSPESAADRAESTELPGDHRRSSSRRSLIDVRQRLARMSRSVDQFRAHLRSLPDTERHNVREEAAVLKEKLESFLEELT